MTRTRLIPQTAPWYDRLATLQMGYHYPWRSTLGAWHGEDVCPALERIFAEFDARRGARHRDTHDAAEGVAIRRRRYLWKAIVP